MRARVTGGAGFIGSHLVDRLIPDGHRVAVIMPPPMLGWFWPVPAAPGTGTAFSYPRRKPACLASKAPYGIAKYGTTPPIYSDSKRTRDDIYVVNVVDAFLAAIYYTGEESIAAGIRQTYQHRAQNI